MGKFVPIGVLFNSLVNVIYDIDYKHNQEVGPCKIYTEMHKTYKCFEQKRQSENFEAVGFFFGSSCWEQVANLNLGAQKMTKKMPKRVQKKLPKWPISIGWWCLVLIMHLPPLSSLSLTLSVYLLAFGWLCGWVCVKERERKRGTWTVNDSKAIPFCMPPILTWESERRLSTTTTLFTVHSHFLRIRCNFKIQSAVMRSIV